MVKMNDWKVKIRTLTDFNNDLNLIHYSSRHFQRFLETKSKSITGHLNGSNSISNNNISDEIFALVCYLLKNKLIICYSYYLSLLIFRFFCFFMLHRTQWYKINHIDPLTIYRHQYIPKKYKLHFQKKKDRHHNTCLNLWIKTHCLTWTSPLIFLIS